MVGSGPKSASRDAAPALRLDDVTKRFDGVKAVSGVSLQVPEGQRIGILGPNGAGKTTLFKLISGELRPTLGRILLRGRDVTRVPVHRRVRLGLGQTFQITNLFLSLRVKDNVLLAARAAPDGSQDRRFEEVVEQFALLPLLERRVGELSYGQQRGLELALALASGASILLLDEPAAGLGPSEREVMLGLIGKLPSSLTILLIEHDIELALRATERIVCLHHGGLVADDRTDRIRDHPAVQEIYLGAPQS